MAKHYSLQLPDDVFEAVRVAADENHVSVNELLIGLVADGIEQRRGLKAIRDRANRSDVAAVLAILDRVPDAEPELDDRLL